MNAALYARKSKPQPGVAESAKSTTLQIAEGRAFAAKQGWTVVAEFIDDGISGAEFSKRPGFMKLMAPHPQFQVLVVSELKSLGREMTETSMALKQLSESGVEVFEYEHGKSLTPKNALDKMMSSVQAFADEDHRVKTSERMHRRHAALARDGRVTGGRCFGYRNKDVFNGIDQHGRPKKERVDYEIIPEEAAVVRRIFEMYAAGDGLRRIARTLNAEKAPSPRYAAPKDGLPPLGEWSPSTIRSVLRRRTYVGVKVWNTSRKKNDWGKWAPSKRPESEWVTSEYIEDLRIIDERLWVMVQSRRADTEGKTLRFASGRLSGRPPKGEVRNLLAGLASCGVCGGSMIVHSTNRKMGDAFGPDNLPAPGELLGAAPRTGFHYLVCARRRQYSDCSNQRRVLVSEVNEAILQAVEEHCLTPAAIESVIQLSERDDLAQRRDTLEAEAKEAEGKIKRLTKAIEDGGAKALVARVLELEDRQRAIDGELAGLRPIPRLAPKIVEDRLTEWRRLLRKSMAQGRAVLQRVIRGRIVFLPRKDGEGYDFSAETRFDRLFSGVVIGRPFFIPVGTEGTEHLDTLESDYERLLARVEETALNGWRAWRESNPLPTGSKPVALSE